MSDCGLSILMILIFPIGTLHRYFQERPEPMRAPNYIHQLRSRQSYFSIHVRGNSPF